MRRAAAGFRVGYSSIHLRGNDSEATLNRKISGDKGDTTQSITSLKQLKWYAGELNREEAESLLIKDGIQGTYLMRKSPRHDEFAISVRTCDCILHFIVRYDPFDMEYKFGPEVFSSLEQFIAFFEGEPIITYGSGEKEVMLNRPYYNPNSDAARRFEESLDASYDSVVEDWKEGYLIKRGAFHKNWKERWFTVRDDVMKYFNKRLDRSPLRIVNLDGAVEVVDSQIDNKRNCFCLVFSWRTFYFVANNTDEKNTWMYFFQDRINKIKANRENMEK